jgi:hypothetical protein
MFADFEPWQLGFWVVAFVILPEVILLFTGVKVVKGWKYMSEPAKNVVCIISIVLILWALIYFLYHKAHT